MDNLDRMYRHLVRVVRSRFPQHLVQPFTVAELNQTILPYRLHRRELGLETNDDYEITLTELVSGSRDYLIVDEAMRDALTDALAQVNPDPAAFKQFAQASVALSPSALRSLEVGTDEAPVTGAPSPAATASPVRSSMRLTEPAPTPAAPAAPPRGSSPRRAPTPAAPVAAVAPVAPVAPASQARSATPISNRSPAVPTPTTTTKTSGGVRVVVPQAGERCRSCSEPLPEGRPITFCPHCGQNVTTLNCPACGAELELGWKFCPSCGRPAATK